MFIVTDVDVMKSDPAETVGTSPFKMPPWSGPGSGKAAWKEWALHLAEANNGLSDVIKSQSATIAYLNGEVALLRQEAAARKPTGSRKRLSDDKVARIEAEIAEGMSARHIASRFGVSAMTVSRIARRMRSRARA